MNLIITIVVLLLSLSACSEVPGPGVPEPETKSTVDNGAASAGPLCLTDEQEKTIGISCVKAVQKTLPLEIEATGTVQANPNMTTPVISLVPGRVEAVYVQHGDEVKKGQVLAKIRSNEVGQVETDLITKLLELEADRKQSLLKLQLAQKVYDRKKYLLQEKIAAKADVEQAETELQERQADVAANDEKQQAMVMTTKERLRLFGINPKEVDRVVKERAMELVFDITAPRSGVITMRDADNGEMVEAAKTLFSISDLSSVWLVANVLESNLRHIKKGLPVHVNVDSYPDEHFAGTLNFVDSRLDPQTRTLAVRASIDNKSYKLKPEMFAQMRIHVGSTTALMVPEQAVQKAGETSLVYVEEPDNKYREAKVTTGRRIDGYIEVLSGLKAQESVVVKGSLQLLGQALQRLTQ